MPAHNTSADGIDTSSTMRTGEAPGLELPAYEMLHPHGHVDSQPQPQPQQQQQEEQHQPLLALASLGRTATATQHHYTRRSKSAESRRDPHSTASKTEQQHRQISTPPFQNKHGLGVATASSSFSSSDKHGASDSDSEPDSEPDKSGGDESGRSRNRISRLRSRCTSALRRDRERREQRVQHVSGAEAERITGLAGRRAAQAARYPDGKDRIGGYVPETYGPV